MKIRLVVLCCVILLSACGRGEVDVPSDGPIKVTGIPMEMPAGTSSHIPTLEGPLRLLSASPYGPMERLYPGQGVSVTFSQPMVALGQADEPDPGLLSLEPSRGGSLRWEGSQTLVFTPDSPLDLATSYEVTLAAALTSLSGETLDEPVSWSFETPRPSLVASRPAREASYVSPDSALQITFNQGVVARSVRQNVSLYRVSDRREREAEVDLDVASAQDSVFVLRAEGRLRKNQQYELVLDAGIESGVGPLASSRPESVFFRTFPPLEMNEVSQSRPWNDEDTATFDPGRGFQLSFTTPVGFGDLRRAMAVTPALDLPVGIEARDGTVATSHSFTEGLLPETTYTIRIDSLRDSFGQLLVRDQATLRTRAYSPSFSMPQGLLVLEASQPSIIPMRITNVESVRIGAERLTADDIVPLAPVYDTVHYYPLAEGDTLPEPVQASRVVALDVPRNTATVLPLGLDSLRTGALDAREPGGPDTPGTGAPDSPRTGVIALHVQHGTKSTYKALAQFTNLGLTGKFSAHQNLILVTNLTTAQPVSGARVTIRDQENRIHWTGTTDAEGRAQSPGWAALGMQQPYEWESPTQFAIVERGEDLAFTSSRYQDGIEPYRFDIMFDWQPDPVHYAGSLFTDRGLYQSGETVHLKGIIRRRTDRDWQAVRDSVRLIIRDPRDQTALDMRLLPSELGSFNLDWTVPASASQGYYDARVFLASDTTVTPETFYQSSAIGYGTFQVESFRRATFSVDARSARPSYTAGDFFEGTISGRYLFGAAMMNQPVQYSLDRGWGSYQPPGFPGFTFGNVDWFDGLYREIVRGDTLLDEDGMLRVRAQVPGNPRGATTSLTWSATVTDPTEQQVYSSSQITLHPGLFYVGLKPRSTYVSLADADVMEVDLVTVTPDGFPVGDERIELTLIRQQWNSVREVGADGRLRWRSERVEESLVRQRVTSLEDRSLRLELPISQGGSYIIRATSRDVRGNAIATEAYFYASGPGYAAWERRDDDRIELIAEKDTYRPGDTARIMVLSPYEEATALVTVEREGILSSRVEVLTGSAPQIDIELGQEHLPNAFVSVVLLSGRTAAPSGTMDTGAPGFKIGYVNLRVDPGARQLRVVIEPDQPEYRPGDEVTVDFRLLDQNDRGVAGEIAFSAADAGVLNLIGYALPDPFDQFYGERTLGVTTTESRANLVRQRNFGQKEEDMGGGGGDPESRLRQDFRPSAHWEPALRTNGSGRASLTFRLPESLTTFRLMATAATSDHRFGAGQTDIFVNQPLVMQAALPRFARLDDRFEAGVLVTNSTGSDGDVTVTASAEGLTLNGPASQTVPLQDGETREVRFDWSVPSVGEAQLTFTGSLGREEDALSVPLTLTRPVTRNTSATFASTEDVAIEELRLPDSFVPGLGGLEIRLSSTALVGLEGATDYLFTYPYGCLEQRTSAVRPLFLGDELLDAFDLSALQGERDGVTAQWLADLQGFWVGNGFTMWQGGSYTNPYVSAYTVLAMAEAAAAGFEVPQSLWQQALDALEQKVRNRSEKPDYYSERAWDQSRALMLYALARGGRMLTGEIDALATVHLASSSSGAALSGSTLGADGESYLIRTILLANTPALRPHLEPLLTRLRNRIVVEGTSAHVRTVPEPGTSWIFESTVRSTAFALVALIEADPSEDTRLTAERMIQYLMMGREGGAWASTQENAAVVDAFATYFRTYETAAPAFAAQIRLAGQTIIQESFRARSTEARETSLALADLPDDPTIPAEFQMDGQGRLYYSMRLDTWSNEALPAASQGLSVERRIQRLDDTGQPVGEEMLTGSGSITLDSGEMVRVILRVSSSADRNYLVVDDALPAGLEALNSAFLTTNSEAVDAAREDTRTRWWGSFNHTEIRDDRVLLFADYLDSGTHTYVYVARATTPGTFQHPPTQAHLMYQPETSGRTATGTLTVEPPAE